MQQQLLLEAGFTLVACCTAHRVQVGDARVPMSEWHGAVLYLASELQHVVDIGSRQRLRSGSTSALLVPSTRRVTRRSLVYRRCNTYMEQSERTRAVCSVAHHV